MTIFTMSCKLAGKGHVWHSCKDFYDTHTDRQTYVTQYKLASIKKLYFLFYIFWKLRISLGTFGVVYGLVMK